MELVDFNAGEVDLAIRYGTGRYPGLEVTAVDGGDGDPGRRPALLEQNPLATEADLATTPCFTTARPTRTRAAQTGRCGWPRGGRGASMARADPRYNQSSLVIESAVNGRGVALAKAHLGAGGPGRGRLVAPSPSRPRSISPTISSTPRLRRAEQVKAFVAWLTREAETHEATIRTLDVGAGI
jgi:LysR family glycine cleavage system transcriptional activator